MANFTQRTIIDQIEIRRDGTVQVRFDKQVLKDGVVIQSGWHRGAWAPGTYVEQHRADINRGLVDLGAAEVGPEDWARIMRVLEMEHTPEVVKAFAEARSKSE